MAKKLQSPYWSGLSTVIRDGEKLKTDNYEYTVLNLINDGASIVYKARRSDNKIISYEWTEKKGNNKHKILPPNGACCLIRKRFLN